MAIAKNVDEIIYLSEYLDCQKVTAVTINNYVLQLLIEEDNIAIQL